MPDLFSSPLCFDLVRLIILSPNFQRSVCSFVTVRTRVKYNMISDVVVDRTGQYIDRQR